MSVSSRSRSAVNASSAGFGDESFCWAPSPQIQLPLYFAICCLPWHSTPQRDLRSFDNTAEPFRGVSRDRLFSRVLSING